MKTFLLGVATGYVLGSRAGRQRYEEIVRAYRRLIDHPMVQGAAGVIKAKLSDRGAR
jgi:tryptophan synthase beta subunit